MKESSKNALSRLRRRTNQLKKVKQLIKKQKLVLVLEIGVFKIKSTCCIIELDEYDCE